MKRTEMSRGSKPMKRGKLRRVVPRRDPTPPEWQSYHGVCPLCLTPGLIDVHHLIPKRVLKRNGLSAHLWDLRNALPAGRDCCHTAHESRRRPLPRAYLPAEAEEFAVDMNLVHVLDRVYGER